MSKITIGEAFDAFLAVELARLEPIQGMKMTCFYWALRITLRRECLFINFLSK